MGHGVHRHEQGRGQGIGGKAVDEATCGGGMDDIGKDTGRT